MATISFKFAEDVKEKTLNGLKALRTSKQFNKTFSNSSNDEMNYQMIIN